MHIGGVYCRESAGTGPVIPKVVPVTGAAFSDIIMDQLLWTLSPTTTTINSMVDFSYNTESI